MANIFMHIINMSISASYIVLAVLLLRLVLKKAPRWITVILWGIVAVRLICPFSFESIFSLIPSAETVSQDIMTDKTPQIVSGISILNNTLNPIIEELFAPVLGASANPLQIWIPILTAVWVIGVVALLTYTIISYAHVRRKIGTAVLLHENIYQSENIASPFVLGLIRPKIYLPFRMNEKDVTYVVAHEQAHIRRKDYLWKPIGFLLLTLHWFNPLMWLGYILLCRDIELACDEKVIKELDRNARADYSQALLTCSVNRPMITACPLAFGEVGVKDRVECVLNYKKPCFWIVMVAVAACVVLGICYLTNPIDKDNVGVNSVSTKRTNSDVIDLNIRYSYPTGSYSVRSVSEDEGEYCGDGINDYDGALGKYRILISFGDTEPSKAFRETHPVGEVVELKNAPIKMRLKRVHPQDHGFSLYVGFDFPVVVESIEKGQLKMFGGTIKIPITVLSNDLVFGYDTAIFDIDGDGVEENCSMRPGNTSGLFTFIFTVRDKMSGEVEYETVVYSQVYKLSFQKGDDGITRVQGITQGASPKVHLFDISISDGKVILTENGVYIGNIY